MPKHRDTAASSPHAATGRSQYSKPATRLVMPQVTRPPSVACCGDGPLTVPRAVFGDKTFPHPLLASGWRAELVAFLRSGVRARARAGGQSDRDAYGRMWTRASLQFKLTVHEDGGARVVIESAQDAQDVVTWQFVLLMLDAGLMKLTSCQATDCAHIFLPAVSTALLLLTVSGAHEEAPSTARRCGDGPRHRHVVKNRRRQ